MLPNVRGCTQERGGNFLLIQLLAKTTKQTLLCRIVLFLFYRVFLPNLTLQIPSHSFVNVTFFSSTNKYFFFYSTSNSRGMYDILLVQVLSDLVRKNGIYYRKTLRWNFRVIGNFLHLGSTSHESRIYEFLGYDYVAKGRRDFF